MHSLIRLAIDFSGISTKANCVFSFVCGVMGAFINLFGGWSASLSVLIWLVVGDYVSGLIASVIEGKGLSSRIGYVGIAKKVAIFFLVLVAHKLDVAIQVNVMMNVVAYFYITNELISLTENLGRMGVPVPKQLVNIIYALKGKSK